MSTGAFTANPGAGGATFAADLVGVERTPLSKIDIGAAGVSSPVTSANPMPVTMSNTLALTDTQLRASAVPVSISGVASETTLAALNTKMPVQGQAAMAASSPVVIASNQSAIPVTSSAATSTGTITTVNLVPAGVATAGSAVELVLNSKNALSVQVTGTYTGALSLQVTIDGAVWVTVGGTPFLSMATNGYLATITSALQGVFQAETTSMLRCRVTALAAVTGAATITLLATEGTALVALDAAIPAGANAIGSVIASGTVTSNQGTANAAAWLANPLTSQITAEASSAKIATGNSAATIVNPSSTGVMLFLNASVVTGTTPMLTVRVQVLDPVSGGWVDLPGASYPAVIAVTASPLLLVIGLGVVAVANAAVNMPLPRSWRLAWVITGTTPSFTFSVGAQYLV